MASGWDAEWRHHDISTPVLTAATLYAIEAAAALAGHDGVIDTVAGGAALGALIAAWGHRRHFLLQVYLTALTLITLAWVLYAEAASPFTLRALTAFAVSAVVLGPLYAVANRADLRERRRAAERAAALLRKRVALGDWEAMFAQLGAPGVTLEPGSRIETRAGHRLTFRLPGNGRIVYRQVSGLAEQIATAMDMDAHRIRFERGPGALFHVHVITRNVMGETIPYPFDPAAGPISVNDAFDLGIAEDGEDATALLREIHALISGVTGAGKSNLLHVLIAKLTQCSDTVIWMIDLKGGRTAKPWLTPWINGDDRAHRPVIDWVATTLDEAQLMLECLTAAIDFRSHTGTGEKIIPSPRQPQIVLICDEVATVFGMNSPGGHKRASLLENAIGRGRSEAILLLLAVLRSTVTSIGNGDIKAQCKLRMALAVASAQDARLALDDSALASGVAALRDPGSMYLQDDARRPIPTKIYRLLYDLIPTIAATHSAWRPGLEDELEDYLGPTYQNRWTEDRAGHLMPGHTARHLQPFRPSTTGAPATIASRPAPAPGRIDLNLPPLPGPITPAYRDTHGNPLPRTYSPDDVERVLAEYRGDIDEAGDGADIHPGRARMIGLIAEAMPAGIAAGELTKRLNEAGISAVRQTVHEWLKAELAAKTITARESLYYTADGA